MSNYIYTSEDIYNSIKHSIINFEYPPKTQMSENEIAKKFGVSRTPVKAVFTRLESEGFIEVLPQRGTYVSSLDKQKIKDFIYMRLILEVDMFENFIKTLNDSDILELEKLIFEQKKSVNDKDFVHMHFFEEDVKFHGYLFDKVGHSGIWAEIQKLQVNYTRFRMLDITQNSKLITLIDEHLELFQAIKDKNSAKYKELLNKHLTGNFEQTVNSNLKEYFI